MTEQGCCSGENIRLPQCSPGFIELLRLLALYYAPTGFPFAVMFPTGNPGLPGLSSFPLSLETDQI